MVGPHGLVKGGGQPGVQREERVVQEQQDWPLRQRERGPENLKNPHSGLLQGLRKSIAEEKD